jgi:hypothetical protein
MSFLIRDFAGATCVPMYGPSEEQGAGLEKSYIGTDAM